MYITIIIKEKLTDYLSNCHCCTTEKPCFLIISKITKNLHLIDKKSEENFLLKVFTLF